MKRVYTVAFPAPFTVDFTDDERRAIAISRAVSISEMLEKFAEKTPLAFSHADAVVMFAALQQFIEKGTNAGDGHDG